jgi:hypothetical protein
MRGPALRVCLGTQWHESVWHRPSMTTRSSEAATTVPDTAQSPASSDSTFRTRKRSSVSSPMVTCSVSSRS